MSSKMDVREARKKRHARLRLKLEGTASRPRLCVFRSVRQIYAQVIDDEAGHTLVSASTLDADISSQVDSRNKTAKAELVGALVARRALEQGIEQVVFDRGGYKYHGRVKALAEAARGAGLRF
ncbi:MAG: 50S ribosomal protein L18 [Chloroflexi bacterium RBG_13_54_9]|nr:MAG: 50S ribosomal protein L18 [Chloroflexi bacterium RBG_13_54_9]